MPMWVEIEETDQWRDCWGQVRPWRGVGCEVRAIGSDASPRSHITISLLRSLPHNTHPPQKGLRWPHCCTGSETGLKHTVGLLLIRPYAQSTRLVVDSVTKVLSFSLHHRQPSPHRTHFNQGKCFLNFHRMTHTPGKESHFHKMRNDLKSK